jgi:hypothetical protein
LFVLTVVGNVNAQEKKSVEALRITTPLKIDGILDEPEYKEAKPATDFVQIQPYNGKPCYQKTEVYIFYDQSAIYVGAMLYDSSPDSIFTFFTERDNIGMSDYFGIYLDPYNQGQLAYGFFISSSGVQTDLKAIKSDGDNEDGSWDAVWESKTRLTDKGWVLELRIPYAALRFSEKAGSTWGLNMFRNIRRYNSNNSWNFIDRKVAGFIHQEGQLTGIKDIKPPVRLSLSPYVSTYLDYKNGSSNPEFLYKGGLDVKYGLSESFTLDMMLIPDFGQIQSDDKQLNLSPYELYYNEKRQFFTEGTELFQRGGVFYSRRIGAQPKFSNKADDALATDEKVDYSPSETQLVNATKISGRTNKGLGIGFLNAISLPSYAKLKDTITGSSRKVLVQPLTNYNVTVIDKSLKNNSYVSFINSNMSMFNNPFMANVTATEFQLRDKSKTYALIGKGGMSVRGDTTYETGYYGKLEVDKNSGKLQYGISQDFYTDKYNPNDLGYLRRNNAMMTQISASYHIMEPFWIVREWHTSTWWDYTRIYKPSDLYSHIIGFDSYVLFKNNYSGELNGGIETNKHDYYEPRVKGWFYNVPYYFWYNIYINTDGRKPLSFYFNYGGSYQPTTGQTGIWTYSSVNLRIGQRFQINYAINFHNEYDILGFVDKNDNEDSIYFGKRDVKILENILEPSLAMTNKMSIRLRIRHYWSGSANKNYLQLERNGNLMPAPSYTQNKDENYNAFNIDMIFRWIFAPGSELSFSWKNSILDDKNTVIGNYWHNLDNTWHDEQTNSLSLKILYYIDYNSLKKKKS